jgi:hypothetical protein
VEAVTCPQHLMRCKPGNVKHTAQNVGTNSGQSALRSDWSNRGLEGIEPSRVHNSLGLARCLIGPLELSHILDELILHETEIHLPRNGSSGNPPAHIYSRQSQGGKNI